MSVEEHGEVTHPGPILRAARDELKMTVDQVAEALHLRASVVLMIESESYEDFSSDVFLKGYFRSYCRLVNLHENRMIELLEKQLAFLESEKQSELRIKEEAATRTKRLQFFKLGAVSAAIVFSGAGFVYLSTNENGQNFDTNGANNAQPALHEESQIVVPEETVPKAGNAASSDQEILTADPEASIEAERGSLIDESVDKPSVAELVEIGEIESSAPEAQVGDQTPGFDSNQNEVFGDHQSILVSFSEECWFEAYDGSETRIGAGLKKAGDEFRYKGALPVRIILGNGNVASIQLNGNNIDFSSSIKRSGRAEVVLGQEVE